jgi:nitrous oxide reductase accessory protein NosL
VRIPGHKTILLLLVALAALAVAGCGGGGDETETTTTPTVEEPTALTEDELIDEGDDVCAEVNAAVGALGATEATEGTEAEEAEKVANLYTGMVERLQDLGAPAEDDGSYAKFMEAAEELAKTEGEVKAAAEGEDLAALGEASVEAEAALEEFQSQAAIYGFEDCSEDPGELPTPGAPGGETEATPEGEEFEGFEEEGGVEPEPEYVEPEYEEPAPEEEAPETGGAGGGVEETPEVAPETGGESGGVGPG